MTFETKIHLSKLGKAWKKGLCYVRMLMQHKNWKNEQPKEESYEFEMEYRSFEMDKKTRTLYDN